MGPVKVSDKKSSHTAATDHWTAKRNNEKKFQTSGGPSGNLPCQFGPPLRCGDCSTTMIQQDIGVESEDVDMSFLNFMECTMVF